MRALRSRFRCWRHGHATPRLDVDVRDDTTIATLSCSRCGRILGVGVDVVRRTAVGGQHRRPADDAAPRDPHMRGVG